MSVYVQSSDGEQSSELRQNLQEDIWSKHKKMTSEDFKTLMTEYREQQADRSKQRDTEASKHELALMSKLAEKSRNKHIIEQVRGPLFMV